MANTPENLIADGGYCTLPGRGPNAERIPDLMVFAHDGQRARFYSDLLLGRTVLINCMSIASEREHASSANLAKVQDELGQYLGRDFFMYSITTDPERDTPGALRAFARKMGARPGWQFLTGDPVGLEQLRTVLFPHAGHHHHHGHGSPSDPSFLGVARYGNESVGIWGGVPVATDPLWLSQRLLWVHPKQKVTGASRRRGPVPPGERT